MTRPPKRPRRLIREYASLAYEAELRLALQALAAEFDRWRAGELSSFDLSDAIHRFHDGESRELWKSYNYGHAEWALARAVHTGVLERDLLPAELLDYLGGELAFLAQRQVEEINEGERE